MGYASYVDEKVWTTPFYKRVGFWITVPIFAISFVSLGEGLFSGPKVLNTIIDTWHGLFEPVLRRMNSNSNLEFLPSLSTRFIDGAIVALSMNHRMMMVFVRLIRSVDGSDAPSFRLMTIGSYILETIVMLAVLFQIQSDGTMSYNPVWHGQVLLGSLLVTLILLKLVPAYGELPFIVAIMSLCMITISLSPHADENLPYIERWHQAWMMR